MAKQNSKTGRRGKIEKANSVEFKAWLSEYHHGLDNWFDGAISQRAAAISAAVNALEDQLRSDEFVNTVYRVMVKEIGDHFVESFTGDEAMLMDGSEPGAFKVTIGAGDSQITPHYASREWTVSELASDLCDIYEDDDYNERLKALQKQFLDAAELVGNRIRERQQE